MNRTTAPSPLPGDGPRGSLAPAIQLQPRSRSTTSGNDRTGPPASGDFQTGCGMGGPLGFVVLGPGRERGGEPILLEQPFALAGRDEHSCVRLADSRISHRHAYLQAIAGRVFCVDMGSRAGVRWKGVRRSRGWLDTGWPVQVGPFTVMLCPLPTPAVASPVAFPTGDWDPLEDRVSDPALVPPVTVEISRAGNTRARWRMNRALALVGGSSGCRVRLRDASVSRFHCSLVASPGGVWVVDLLSRTGTWVNGKSVRWAPLADGDLVRVGEYQLHFRYEQQQMFNQFQQILMGMAQLFVTMHKDHAGVVQKALEQLSRVTSERHLLREEQKNHSAGLPPAPAQPPDTTDPAPACGAETTQPAPHTDNVQDFAAINDVPRLDGAYDTLLSPAREKAGEEIHTWLSQRLCALQEEPQSAWQKLFGLRLGR